MPVDRNIHSSPVGQVRTCEDLLFSGSAVPLTCHQALGQTEGLEVSIDASGTVRFARGDTNVLTLLNFATSDVEQDTLDNIITSVNEDDKGVLHVHPGLFSVDEDVTFDGIPDVRVYEMGGAYQSSFRYYTLSTTTNTLKPVGGLPSLIDPDFDDGKKMITSFSKGRGLGDIYTLSQYSWNGAMYVLTREESQDENEDGESYVNTVKEMKNGKLQVISKKTLSSSDVWGN
jgi:hypothetical protein